MANVPNSLYSTAPTTYEDWVPSDKYHNSFLLPQDDPVLDAVLKKNSEQGLPDSAPRPSFSRAPQCSSAYSTIWLARALPESGSLLSLEILEKHAKTARENIANAGLASKVEVVVGPALQSLSAIPNGPPFDLAFLDADKPSNPAYFMEAKRLVKKGGIIIVDNVVHGTNVADPALSDENVEGVRRLLQAIKGDKEVEVVTIATVGEKGYDGFLYAIRK